MKRNILVCLALLLTLQATAWASTYHVDPGTRDYPDIQSALNAIAANPNPPEVIILAPDVYTGPRNTGLTLSGANVTIRSWNYHDNPDPNIVATTIIDCQGSASNPNRAFTIQNSSILQGITIINGYQRGVKGLDGVIPGQPINPAVVTSPPDANDGNDSPPASDPSSQSYGGALLINGGSTPIIEWCVFKNNVVTGSHGGAGDPGQNGLWTYPTIVLNEEPNDPNNWPPVFYPHPSDPNLIIVPEITIEEVDDGQWGGDGGDGYGYGHGGAIACRSGSSPIISNCIFEDNEARGGIGGAGGAGGNATFD